MKKLATLILVIYSISISFAQTAKEVEMIELINQVRTNPKSFIPVVEDYIKNLETNGVGLDKIKIKGAVIRTKTSNCEANTANLISEAKKLVLFLKQVKSVTPLEVSSLTYKVTKTQAIFLDSTKQVTHNGPNGISFAERTKGYLLGENCGTGDTATNALLQFLIDIGSKDKGHRANIFNSNYKSVSVGNTGNYWVQDFGF